MTDMTRPRRPASGEDAQPHSDDPRGGLGPGAVSAPRFGGHARVGQFAHCILVLVKDEPHAASRLGCLLY